MTAPDIAAFALLLAYALRYAIGFALPFGAKPNLPVEHLTFAAAGVALTTAYSIQGNTPCVALAAVATASFAYTAAALLRIDPLHANASRAVHAATTTQASSLVTPTAILTEEPVPGPFAAVTWRALPDRLAQLADHDTGLIVFLDDAERILSDGQTEAYAEGRADQAADQIDDPEQADAEHDDIEEPDPEPGSVQGWMGGDSATGSNLLPGRRGATGFVTHTKVGDDGTTHLFVQWSDRPDTGPEGPYSTSELLHPETIDDPEVIRD